MKHALRKYLSPCGSALFMVVSTMAALIVMVTAMYMSVLSSRQVQLATFDQEQAYVSSTSIADIVCSYIADGKNSGSQFVQAVLNLENPGDSISTNGNGFASLSSTGTNEDTLLGGYDVAVTKMKDEKISNTTWHVYDIAVTVANNDVLETTHTFLRTKDPEDPDLPDIDRFFTATGYIPNDVWIDSGIYNNTMYFDAEYVKFGNTNGGLGALDINSGIICAGSAVFQHGSAQAVVTPEPTLWVIGNNMTIKSQPNEYDLGGTADDHGLLIVGGDLDVQSIANFGASGKPTDVYVLGNLYITAETNFYGNVYVNGGVYVTLPSNGNVQVKFHNGKLYQTSGGIFKVTMNPNDSNGKKTLIMYDNQYMTIDEIRSNIWSVTESSPDDMMSQADVSVKLNEAIGGSVYVNWVVDVEEANKNVKNIFFNTNWGETDLTTLQVPDPRNPNDPDKNLSLCSYYKLTQTTMLPKYVEVIDSDCTIGDIVNVGAFGGFRPTIIFDTGNAGNTLTINLSANTDLNPDDTDYTPTGFAWSTAKVFSNVIEPHSADKLVNGDKMNILTVGDGNLVINVPDIELTDQNTGEKYTQSLTYQASSQEFFGHYAWFMYTGGSVETQTYNGYNYDRYYVGKTSTGAPAMIYPMIHEGDGCTKCADPANNQYVECKNDKGEDGWTCQIHGGFIESDEKPDTCQCNGRIEKNKFPTDAKYYYDGELQRPNVNIFLVSCSESADIQIGCIKYPFSGLSAINMNVFYGYVYAPYMTYMDKTDGQTNGLKSVGGLIVSDYIMASNCEYIYAKSDQTIEEVAGTDIKGYLEPSADRSWRIHGV